MTTWVLVADGRRARVFSAELPACKSLWEIHTLVHLHNERRTSAGMDRRRRVFESATTARHASEPGTSPVGREIKIFVREIAQYLHREFGNHSFDNLVLVAAPHFMGALNTALDARVASLVSLRIIKDFAELPATEIAERLRDELALG